MTIWPQVLETLTQGLFIVQRGNTPGRDQFVRMSQPSTALVTAACVAPHLLNFIFINLEICFNVVSSCLWTILLFSQFSFGLALGGEITVTYFFFLFWLYTYIQFLWVIRCLTFICLYRPLGPFRIMLYIDASVRFVVPCRGRDLHYGFMLVASISVQVRMKLLLKKL